MECSLENGTTTELPGQPGAPCIMVIFGASGDLVKRKLIPALYNLTRERLLSKEFAVVGFARHEMSHEEFRTKISEAIKEFFTGAIDQELWNWLVNRLYYVSGDLQEPAAYQRLQN